MAHRPLGIVIAAWLLMLGGAGEAAAARIYVSDITGRIGVYDTDTGTGTALGAIGDFITFTGRIFGLAYDPAGDDVVLLDRDFGRAYALAGDGSAAAILTSTAAGFQGGAISGGLLYGIFEGSQQIDAFDIATGVQQFLAPAPPPFHAHALGVDARDGLLYTILGNREIREVAADGSIGAAVVAADIVEFADDIDPLGDDFLVTAFSARRIDRIDRQTGARTTLLGPDDLAAMGVTGNISGVAVALDAQAVAAPASAAIFVFGLVVVGLSQRRRRN
jgi:hypothetical protein